MHIKYVLHIRNALHLSQTYNVPQNVYYWNFSFLLLVGICIALFYLIFPTKNRIFFRDYAPVASAYFL